MSRKQPEPPAVEPRYIDREPGSVEHYVDAALYDHEYRRRRRDVHYYVGLAREKLAEPSAAQVGCLVELGCGSGRILVPLVRAGLSAVGVDRSRPMLLRAAAQLARLPPGRTAGALLLQGDLRALPLGPRLVSATPGGAGAADVAPSRRVPLVIAAFHTLQHLYTRQDFDLFFAQARELLTDDGWLAFDVLNPDLQWLLRDPRKRWARSRFTHPTTGEKLIYSTNHFYDAATQLAHIQLYYTPAADAPAGVSHEKNAEAPQRHAPRAKKNAASERVVRLTHRQLFPQELLTMIDHYGFRVVRRWGGFDGEPFTDGAESQVLVIAPRPKAPLGGRGARS